MNHCVTVKVPAKIMLAGEYAVLQGGPVCAAAVPLYLEARAWAAPGNAGWEVHSSYWKAPRHVALNESYAHEPLLDAVQQMAKQYSLPAGHLQVTSAIDPTFGLGSSSALRLAVCAALSHLAQRDLVLAGLIQDAISLQRQAQGTASGYDIITQAYGGILHLTPLPQDTVRRPLEFTVETLQVHSPALSHLQLFVGGSGAPTTQTIAQGLQWISSGPGWPALLQESKTMVLAFTKALQSAEESSWENLYHAIENWRKLCQGGPLMPDSLADLASIPGIGKEWAFKTSGAGGEDALILVGSQSARQRVSHFLEARGWRSLNLKLGCQGIDIQRSSLV